MSTFRTIAIIPARLASTRLPRKVLREIAGRPMLAWVYQAAIACKELSAVVVATDSDEVVALCRRHGWPVELTAPTLASGSDRVHAVAQGISADIYVNIQGDEPLLRPEHISTLLRPFSKPHVEISTLKVPCTLENINNPNAVKVVTAADGRALYFSRSPIPYDRDGTHPQYWKHLGLYAYRKSALDRMLTLSFSQLESAEKLEQLRFLENNIDIYVEPIIHDTIGVDTEDDLRSAEAALLRRAAAQSR